MRPTRLPPITSTSRAQTEGQSCGQTEGRRVTSVIAFMSLLQSSRLEPPVPVQYIALRSLIEALELARELRLHLQPNTTTKLQSFEPAEQALAIRLFLSACVAATVLGAAWTEKKSEAESSQPEIHYAPRENLENLDAREIGRAELSIDMAASSSGFIWIGSQFAEHGPTRGGPVEALLARPNVVARVKGEGVLMHLKAY